MVFKHELSVVIPLTTTVGLFDRHDWTNSIQKCVMTEKGFGIMTKFSIILINIMYSSSTVRHILYII